MNENLYGETAEAFHLSHELAHFTASHFEYSVLYDTSTTFHSKFETEADKIAILILLNIYIENELTDESQFNLENLWSIILFRISSDTLVMLSANAILRKNILTQGNMYEYIKNY